MLKWKLSLQTSSEPDHLFEKLKVLTVSIGPHSKFPEAGSSANYLSMSAPYPNSANHSVNPLLPDVTKDIYATDEFRMYSYKVEKCPYDGRHKWSQCPFTHTGDRDRRRDPKKYLYEHKRCYNFTYNSCEYGDQCGKSHGKYEKGLHPDFYRTELCSVEPPCTRPICFYAHTQEQLRKTSSSLFAYSRYAAGIAIFEPAQCPVPDSLSISVTLPMPPSTIEISNNAPNYTFECSSEQTILETHSLSANSPSPETPFSSNMEDGFPGQKYHTYYGPFSPTFTSTDRSRKQKPSMLSPSRTLDDETWFGPEPDVSWVDALLDEPEDQSSVFTSYNRRHE